MVDKVEITSEPTNSPTLEEQAKQQEEKSQPEAQQQVLVRKDLHGFQINFLTQKN